MSNTSQAPSFQSPIRSPELPVIVFLFVGPLLLIIFKFFPALDVAMFHSAPLHVLFSGGASLLGALLAVLVLRVAFQAYDTRVFWVGLGFLGVASIFFIHAIATPNVLIDGRTKATQWSGLLSLVIGGAFFALSGLPLRTHPEKQVRTLTRIVVPLFAVFWVLYTGTVLFWPPLINQPTTAQTSVHNGHDQASEADEYGPTSDEADEYGPTSDEADEYGDSPITATPTTDTERLGVTLGQLARSIAAPLVIFGMLCYGYAVYRHTLFYRNAPSQAGLALICGITLLGESLLTQALSKNYTTSFWLYHILEFTGFGVIAYAVLFAYHRGQNGTSFFENLFLSGTRSRIHADYHNTMEQLIATFSHSDQPTPELRNELREKLGLSETQIQVLEQAAGAVAQERRQRHELETLNAELRHVEQMRDQLTQMVVHDLKNPLTALIGFLEILRLGHLSEDQRPLVDGALRSGRNLNSLIEDLLDIGRMEQGRLELELGAINPLALLEDSANQLHTWARQEEKRIVIDVDPELTAFEGDQRLLSRVMLNLLSNAIKHTPKGTIITLGAEQRLQQGQQAVEIRVSDNGNGIDADLLPHIFEKYTRGGGSSNRRQSSTGLGLTFCRMAVEQHGGTIQVESEPGHGTTFTIHVPLGMAAEPALSF